ncbi:MBL fold metallo-hydrolase [Paenibacillus oenotherae]|uniref:MBL fold metallo-hydrolase n=1 Tax=Paenibacillus oenotherae TaxID=1435645 RepID=A0ABS7DBI8_9BACL|nr:MBL fold metallo-hydrolase [Paenibacillus oenotherae]MBW7477210.1 MBL fold metallo-hydrolase [Paenibacillus oenotherae]
MQLTLFSAGYCKQLEAISIRGGKWRSMAFPAIFGCIEHPYWGLILFDTGYSSHFFRASDAFPYRLYRWTTPVTYSEGQSALHQLKQRGYRAEDIRYIFLSHFHADHVGGLRDFPNARIICSAAAYESVAGLQGFAAVKKAFLPDLMPDDIKDRLTLLGPSALCSLPASLAPFTHGYDVMGDGSLLAIDLPGHAVGQLGLYMVDRHGAAYLLGADASWSARAIRESRLPHPIAFALFDSSAYKETFRKLEELHHNQPRLQMIFSHCHEAWERCRVEEEGRGVGIE